MKRVTRSLIYLGVVMTVVVFGYGACWARVTSGQIAPGFSLKSVHGSTYDLSVMKKRAMVILYFFDVESRPSQEGLLSLDKLAKQYKGVDLTVWGITLSPKEKVSDFLSQTSLSFPVLLDKSDVNDLYQARLITPTVCILGPELVVLDYFQGGGKTTEVMLVALAERKLQQKQMMLAKAISDEVVRKNSKNLKANMIRGYANLEEGNLPEAENAFNEVSKMGTQGEVLGKEGLTAVYAKKGETDKALKMAAVVEQMAPDRAYVNVVKGDLLFRRGDEKAAEAEYKKAANKPEGESFQKATAYNQLGRFHATKEDYEEARQLYDQAIELDPYYAEATSNKGITYEKEGQWDKALKAYQRALTLDKEDAFAAALVKRAQDMLFVQKDIAEKERLDKLVKDLAARYRSQKETRPRVEDTWTSRPMVLSFVDFQEQGGLVERDGLSMVLITQLGDQLNASGRMQVVERVLVERLLEELNLGSSDLADPETALRIGKILAAKVIGTGSLFHLPDGTLLSLRLIDTETTAISKVITRQLGSQADLGKELHRLNWEILRTIIQEYPLQGYVMQAAGDEVMINLGSRQGVVLGTKFQVLEEPEPIKYKGKTLRGLPKPIALIEVVRVEPDFSRARVLSQEQTIRPDTKIKEKMSDVVAIEWRNAG